MTSSGALFHFMRAKLKYLVVILFMSTLFVISGLSKQLTWQLGLISPSSAYGFQSGDTFAPLFDAGNTSLQLPLDGMIHEAFSIEKLVPVRNEFVYSRLNWITTSAYFQRLVKRKPSNDDAQVLDLIRRMLDPPSQRMRKHSLPPYKTPQSRVLEKVVDVTRKGFFVECGALDGERSSNTNYLESKYGWQGLLVEADPSYYTQLLGKNRKSWSINACLSPVNRTSFITFGEMGDGRGHVVMEGTQEKFEAKTKYIVPCFTLESMMLALNRSTIGFFSLDVEGAEAQVLKTINFQKLDIKTLTVEYEHVEGGEAGLTQLLTSRGMKFYEKVIDKDIWAKDLFFVKQ